MIRKVLVLSALAATVALTAAPKQALANDTITLPTAPPDLAVASVDYWKVTLTNAPHDLWPTRPAGVFRVRITPVICMSLGYGQSYCLASAPPYVTDVGPYFPAGSSVSLNYRSALTSSNYNKIYVSIDVYNQVAERDETNNTGYWGV